MKYYTFNDVMLKPKYSEIDTRSSVSLSVTLDRIQLSVPIISSNMKDITGKKMALEMARYGCLGILHRFYDVRTNVNELEGFINEASNLVENPEWKIGVSIGVQDEELKIRLKELVNAGAKIVCIDIAHGHHIKMRRALEYIKDKYQNSLCIIAGNVATKEGAHDLVSWGANIIKVGIGSGRCCETRKNTGVGVPQLGALDEIRTFLPDIPIISDGGIKYNGDIAKALKFADAVMIGSIFAGTSETPGNVYENEDKQFYKLYRGSASAESKDSIGDEHKFIEGVMITVPFKGHVKHIIKKMVENLQSSLSYVGARNIEEFKQKAELIFITGEGAKESKL